MYWWLDAGFRMLVCIKRMTLVLFFSVDVYISGHSGSVLGFEVVSKKSFEALFLLDDMIQEQTDSESISLAAEDQCSCPRCLLM